MLSTSITHHHHPPPSAHGIRCHPHLDLSYAFSVLAPLSSVLAMAPIIDDLSNVHYPKGIKSPRVELNIIAKDGKFKFVFSISVNNLSLFSFNRCNRVFLSNSSQCVQKSRQHRHTSAPAPSAPAPSQMVTMRCPQVTPRFAPSCLISACDFLQ